ncbi:BnaC03g46970D [Brassica napus]|uniref:BnaC03g46970D protein n=1 Tax=Brassica napus TaxID=3708 RepID=A0A078H175_BRANA|nr:BnaC03g46970D [Brassica napus]
MLGSKLLANSSIRNVTRRIFVISNFGKKILYIRST